MDEHEMRRGKEMRDNGSRGIGAHQDTHANDPIDIEKVKSGWSSIGLSGMATFWQSLELDGISFYDINSVVPFEKRKPRK